MSRTHAGRLLLRAAASCSSSAPAGGGGWALRAATATPTQATTAITRAWAAGAAASSSRASSSLTTADEGKVARPLIVDTLNLVRGWRGEEREKRARAMHLPLAHPHPLLSLSPSPPPHQMRAFEAAGLTRDQAESLTRTVTAVVTAAKEESSGAYVSKGALHTALMERDAQLAGFRAEVGKAAELQAAALTRDTERLGAALDRVRAELRAEVDKATAAQRLDLNLERARLRDDLQALRDKGAEMEIKVDKETSSLRALVESTKNEMIKYSLGVLLTLSTIGLGVARMLGMGR